MKLQEQLSRKVGNKRYTKFVITLPPKLISALGWKKNQDLEVKKEKTGILITPQKGAK